MSKRMHVLSKESKLLYYNLKGIVCDLVAGHKRVNFENLIYIVTNVLGATTLTLWYLTTFFIGFQFSFIQVDTQIKFYKMNCRTGHN